MSYAHLVTPVAKTNATGDAVGMPQYQATLLIPKSDVATKVAIDQAIQTAAQAALATKWGGLMPPQVHTTLYDGDGIKESGELWGDECRGHWILRAKSIHKPGAIDSAGNDLLPTDIYSGMYARASLDFYGYKHKDSGKKGVGCGINNIMKTRDGEAFSGSAPATTDFAELLQQPNPNAWGAPAQPQANPFAT